jgi:hypothetical protein
MSRIPVRTKKKKEIRRGVLSWTLSERTKKITGNIRIVVSRLLLNAKQEF